jgi:hypothetical protein
MSQIRKRTSDDLVSAPEALRRMDMALPEADPAGEACRRLDGRVDRQLDLRSRGVRELAAKGGA